MAKKGKRGNVSCTPGWKCPGEGGGRTRRVGRRAATGSQPQPQSFAHPPSCHSFIHLGIRSVTHSSFPFSHSPPGSPPVALSPTVSCTLPVTDNIPTRLQPLVGQDLPHEAGALSAMTCPQLSAWPWLKLMGKRRVGCFVCLGGRTHSSGYNSGIGFIGKISA